MKCMCIGYVIIYVMNGGRVIVLGGWFKMMNRSSMDVLYGIYQIKLFIFSYGEF